MALAKFICYNRITGLPERLTNIAVGKRNEMWTTEGFYFSSRAVDGNRNGNLRAGSCARTLRIKEPWWLVDLGSKVWVEKVLIANRNDCCDKQLSDLEIRIGRHTFSIEDSN